MEDYSIAMDELLAGGSILSIFAGVSAFILAIFAFIFVFYLVLFIAARIPLYKMAKKAGVNKAWLIWVPIADMYVMLHLSKREYNIFNLIKTNNRTKAFWFYLIACGTVFVCALLLIFAPSILGLLASFIPFIGTIVASGLSIIVSLLWQGLIGIVFIVFSFFTWRVNYDILMTYGMQQHAMWASIVNCICPVTYFCPLLITVFAYIIMNREPDYSI